MALRPVDGGSSSAAWQAPGQKRARTPSPPPPGPPRGANMDLLRAVASKMTAENVRVRDYVDR